MSSSAPRLKLSTQLSRLRQLQRKPALGKKLTPKESKHLAHLRELKQRQAQRIDPWRGNPAYKLKLFPNPRESFRPGQTTRQNRFNENGLRPIRQYSHDYAGVRHCPDPVAAIESEQVNLLDPTGQRTALFAKRNPERVKPGDVLLVRLKNGEPFSGVCISIRQRHSKVDWAILLRNHLTRIATEMWFKIYSSNIESIEVVQRAARRARRARLYYMRKPKHDMGSVEGIVRQYIRKKAGIATATTPAPKKGKVKKKKAQNV